jgi:hypothetical protein
MIGIGIIICARPICAGFPLSRQERRSRAIERESLSIASCPLPRRAVRSEKAPEGRGDRGDHGKDQYDRRDG